MSIRDEARAESLRKKVPGKTSADRSSAGKNSSKVKRSRKYSGERFAQSTDAQSAPKGDITDRIIVAAAAAVLAACVVILGIYFYQMIEAKKNHEDIRNLYENASSQPSEHVILPQPDIDRAALSADNTRDDAAAPTDGTTDIMDIPDDLPELPIYREPLTILPAAAELLAINSDTAGFVKIPGVLEEAVVQTDDNDHYLTHNFYGYQRQCGTVFADHRAVVNNYPDLMSDNIVLYGHNEKNGTMFGNMDYYRWNPTFWQNDPFIYFNTNYEEGTYVIVSSFVTNADPDDDNGNIFDYWNYIDLSDEKRFDSFVKEISERSTIITGVDVRFGDKFITLSTCSTEWDNSRHVLVARKLRDGESETDIDISAFRENTNPRYPAVYYKIFGGSYEEN